nr:MAG TPA: hypothetical protein [Caudoviricetes sp.]
MNSHPVAITHIIIYIVSRVEQPYTKKENREKSFLYNCGRDIYYIYNIIYLVTFCQELFYFNILYLFLNIIKALGCGYSVGGRPRAFIIYIFNRR